MAGIGCCIGARSRVDRSEYVNINNAEMGKLDGSVAPGPANLDSAAQNAHPMVSKGLVTGAALEIGGACEMIIVGASFTTNSVALAIGLAAGGLIMIVGGIFIGKAIYDNNCSTKGICCC